MGLMIIEKKKVKRGMSEDEEETAGMRGKMLSADSADGGLMTRCVRLDGRTQKDRG